MTNRSFTWSFFILLALAFLTGLFAHFPHATASVQHPKDRKISRLPSERNNPIGIVGVTVRGSNILRSRSFLEDDDWLEGLEIRIRNRSDKSILFASIDLQFPRPPGSVGAFAIDEVFYGNRVLVSQLPAGDADISDRMAPGQTLALRLSASDVDSIKRLLILTGYPSGSPDAIAIRIGTVIFSDGTMWRIGNRFRRESEGSPGKWITVEDQLTARSVTRGGAFSGPRLHQNYGGNYGFLSARFSPVREVFNPFSSNVTGLECGKEFRETQRRPCFYGINCLVSTDYLGTNPGSYYLADAYGFCKKADGESCPDVIQGIKVANQCTGGGGGGNIVGFNNTECSSNWDCDLGYSCNSSGQCE